ncbi:MAG: DUF4249 family protein [Saprospirales bacterium]|nr:MAG: DUF4249 family protein [Saprospirales bacterium]
MLTNTFFQNKIRLLLISALLLTLLKSCEEPFEPPIVEDRNELVIEAYLEWSPDNRIPPYVLLTRSFPFINEIGPDFIKDLYVRDARVSIDDGNGFVDLQLICLSDLPEAIRDQLLEQFGIETFLVEVCVYIDLQRNIIIEPERTYRLNIEYDDRFFEAETYIPRAVPLDSLYAISTPDGRIDTLAQLVLALSDPPGPDFYRYFTSVNGGPFIAPLSSVTDDEIIDGQSFEISILKAETRGTDFDPETFGYFTRGDSVVLKWCTISKENFKFWETLEFSRNNQGPFSSYTLVDYNIEGLGGIGLFGGQSCFYYEIEIPLEL